MLTDHTTLYQTNHQTTKPPTTKTHNVKAQVRFRPTGNQAGPADKCIGYDACDGRAGCAGQNCPNGKFGTASTTSATCTTCVGFNRHCTPGTVCQARTRPTRPTRPTSPTRRTSWTSRTKSGPPSHAGVAFRPRRSSAVSTFVCARQAAGVAAFCERRSGIHQAATRAGKRPRCHHKGSPNRCDTD